MSTKRAAGGRGSPPLPVIFAFAFLACGFVLFGVVAVQSAKMSAPAGSSSSSRNNVIIAATGDGANSGNHTNSSSSNSTVVADELRSMLKTMQDQIQELKSALPETIKSELQSHHAATAKQQQQQTKALEPAHAAVAPQAGQQQQQAPPVQGVWLPDHKVHHIARARSACDKNQAAGINLKITDKLVAPVVIVAHNRVHYLAKCLMSLLKYWSADPANAERFPLFVSVDGGDQATMQFAAALNYGAEVQVIHNLRDSSRCKPGDGYCNLSVHYHMLMQLFFECHKAPRLLFMEEDLEVAPDFFTYFSAFAPLLDRDPSLLCVSAWNDHGQRGRAVDPTSMYRTDIFPGLGWMLTATVGLELQQKWPDVYWDEYMREPKTRKGRQCLFPEVSRTHTFGKVGTSGGALFDQHLAVMLLNKEEVDWSKQDLSQYEGEPFAKQMVAWLAAAQPLDASVNLASFCDINQPDHDERGDLIVRYSTTKGFADVARQLPPMLTDVKGGPPEEGMPHLPRGSYRGVVMVRCRGRRLFIAPVPGSPAEPKLWRTSSSSSSEVNSSSEAGGSSSEAGASSSSRRQGPGNTARLLLRV